MSDKREILFRGKRIDNGEWIEGYLFDDGMVRSNRSFIGGIVIEDYEGTADDDYCITGTDFREVIPNTICEYTGLNDDTKWEQLWIVNTFLDNFFKGVFSILHGCQIAQG